MPRQPHPQVDDERDDSHADRKASSEEERFEDEPRDEAAGSYALRREDQKIDRERQRDAGSDHDEDAREAEVLSRERAGERTGTNDRPNDLRAEPGKFPRRFHPTRLRKALPAGSATNGTKKRPPFPGVALAFGYRPHYLASMRGIAQRDLRIQSTESGLSAVPPSVEGVIDRLGRLRAVCEV